MTAGLARPITIQGVKYQSIARAADLNGLPEGTLYYRIMSGWPEERWLEPKRPIQKACKPVRCVDTGRIYPSIQAAATENYIGHGCIWAAVNGKTKTAAGYRWEYVE